MTAKERYHNDPEYREKTLAENREWFRKNKARRRAYNVKRNAETRAEKAESNRKWREANADKHKASARKWHADNKERSTKNKRRWHALNRPKHRAYGQQRRERLKSVESCDKQSLSILQQLIATVPKMKCGICNKVMSLSDRTVDHIIPLVRGGTGNIGNLRVVHKGCNSRKSARMPHEFTGQYEINFAGNGAYPNIRENCTHPVHKGADQTTYCDLKNRQSTIFTNN